MTNCETTPDLLKLLEEIVETANVGDEDERLPLRGLAESVMIQYEASLAEDREFYSSPEVVERARETLRKHED